eukprot:53767-Eustigmatos_ZCMA.PRE.1
MILYTSVSLTQRATHFCFSGRALRGQPSEVTTLTFQKAQKPSSLITFRTAGTNPLAYATFRSSGNALCTCAEAPSTTS